MTRSIMSTSLCRPCRHYRRASCIPPRRPAPRAAPRTRTSASRPEPITSYGLYRRRTPRQARRSGVEEGLFQGTADVDLADPQPDRRPQVVRDRPSWRRAGPAAPAPRARAAHSRSRSSANRRAGRAGEPGRYSPPAHRCRSARRSPAPRRDRSAGGRRASASKSPPTPASGAISPSTATPLAWARATTLDDPHLRAAPVPGRRRVYITSRNPRSIAAATTASRYGDSLNRRQAGTESPAATPGAIAA